MQSVLVVSSVALWVVVLLNLLLTLAVIRRINGGGQVHQMGLKPGTEAPDFTAQTLDGKIVTLASYTGHKVAFIFISPYCQPCKAKIPDFQAIHVKTRQVGVEWVLVNVAGTLADAQAMVADFKITTPLLYAPRDTNPFIRDYQAGGTPSYCMVDEDGKVLSSGYPDSEANPLWKKHLRAWGLET
jgi:peroxiredoxin